MDNRKFGKLVKKSMRPPFNDLVQPNMSKQAKVIMKHAMQRSCDEQVKSLVDWEADTGYEFGKCNKTPEEARSIMKEGVKEFCDEQAKITEDYEKRQIRKTDQEKSKLGAKETAEFIKEQYGDALRRLSES